MDGLMELKGVTYIVMYGSSQVNPLGEMTRLKGILQLTRWEKWATKSYEFIKLIKILEHAYVDKTHVHVRADQLHKFQLDIRSAVVDYHSLHLAITNLDFPCFYQAILVCRISSY